MRYSIMFRRFLMGTGGMTPQFQKQISALMKEVPVVRRTMLRELADPKSVKSSAVAPELADFPELKTFRQLLADLDGLPAPSPSFFDGVVVKPSDYTAQASLRLINGNGSEVLTLEKATNLMLKSVPKLNTGSNNTLDDAITGAEKFRTTFGMNELVHEYLAMDMSWWPSSTESILPLISKNIVTEAAIIPIQSMVNEAAKTNSGLDIAIDSSHSYAQAPRSMALNLFDSRAIIEARSAFFAPLGRPEAMVGLVLAKNNFSGEVSIIRSGLDPLEELATSVGELYLDSTFDLLTTDVRLPTSGHTLSKMTESLSAELKANGISLKDFIDANYTTRPGRVTYFRESTGELERTITTRSGDKYTNEKWLEQYDKLLKVKKSSLTDLIKSQSEQLEELVKITGVSPELESISTSVNEMNDLLKSPSSLDLYDIITEVDTKMSGVIIDFQTVTQAAELKMSSEQKESMDSILKAKEAVEKQVEETTKEIDELSEGEYEPEEV